MNPNLSAVTAIDVTNSSTAGTSDVNGTIVDMSGWDGVIFVTRIPTGAANNRLIAQHGDQSNLGDAADIAGSGVTGTGNNHRCVLDVYKPLKRYLRPVVKRGTSTTSADVWSIRYRGSRPNIADVVDSLTTKNLNSPSSGTA